MNSNKNNNALISQLIKFEPGLFSLFKTGDLVEGRVLENRSNMLMVDLGRFGTGAVYRAEVQNAKEAVKNLKVGDIVHAKVITVDNKEGFVELSLSEAGKQRAWAEVQEIKEKDEPIKVKFLAFNKGGLTGVISGLQAFLPVSQLSTEHYPKTAVDNKTGFSQALELLVGQELTVKIIEANPRNNKLIVSEREATEISTKELVKNYSVGQIVEGIVSSVADFGVFVRFTDNPAVEGLIHISELSHRIIENPKEIVKVDDVVKVKITEIKDGKISLSLKVLVSDPWLTFGEHYKKGQEAKGKVYSFNPFGAIIDLGNELQGQLSVTEFGSVEEMKKQIVQGKEYQFVIEGIKPEEKRIILKFKG
ncbi:MAG: S1 RNA-binding domain-containing protein [Patescibacteria group bacterium]|nr:S1 RNA-binding domain-containing protein [Patescibacteria group bacterium]